MDLKLDVNIIMDDLATAADVMQGVREVGFNGIWVGETQHDAFLQVALLAYCAKQLNLNLEIGTGIAVAFARSPTMLAYTSFDLARLTGGNFILGLGTQVRAHIERRFGMPWASPNLKLRETILALRAIWNTWQNNIPLNFQGELIKLNLMTPFFSPPPLKNLHIPIFISAVNEQNCLLAGELCEGIHVHPLHSIKYLKEEVIPNVQKGLQIGHRERKDIELVSSIFIITGKDERAIERTSKLVKTQIAFYSSTPSYRKVLAFHGWGDVAQELSKLVRAGKWSEIQKLITTDMLSEFAVVGSYDDIFDHIKHKYRDVLDRVAPYLPFDPRNKQDLDFYRTLRDYFTKI
jgi:probable F420-dependent oxidoreductase